MSKKKYTEIISPKVWFFGAFIKNCTKTKLHTNVHQCEHKQARPQTPCQANVRTVIVWGHKECSSIYRSSLRPVQQTLYTIMVWLHCTQTVNDCPKMNRCWTHAWIRTTVQAFNSLQVSIYKMLLGFEHLHYSLLPLWNTELFKAYWVWHFYLFLQKKERKARSLQDQGIKIKILLRHEYIHPLKHLEINRIYVTSTLQMTA